MIICIKQEAKEPKQSKHKYVPATESEQLDRIDETEEEKADVSYVFLPQFNFLFIYLFIWGFTSLSTLYRSYHDG